MADDGPGQPLRAPSEVREEKARQDSPVIVIVGPTGSGKTSASIKIAKSINGEIISADSRAIYKGLDIGTAKPLPSEQDGVPHFGIDLVSPGERFTVADWKHYAEQKIAEIKSRGHVPIVVGGTGLYIDALIFDYQFRGPTGEKSPSEQKNCSDRTEVKPQFIVIGIQTDPDVLRERLRQRADQLFSPALYDETRALIEHGADWQMQAMKSNIYQFAWAYLQGEITLDKAKELFVYDDWHLAKRQLTWFKRNPAIVWLPLERVYDEALSLLSQSSSAKQASTRA